MSRKRHSEDIPYSFISLTSQLQHPTLEIDLKSISNDSNHSKSSKRHKSSHSRHSSSTISDSNYNENDSSSILRPITVETITPPLSKKWKNSSNSNVWEETPIKHVKATPSPMEKLSLSRKDIYNDLEERSFRNDLKPNTDSQTRYNSQNLDDSQIGSDLRAQTDSQAEYDSQTRKSTRSKANLHTKYDSQNDLLSKEESQVENDSQVRDDLRSKTNSQTKYDSQSRNNLRSKAGSQVEYDSQAQKSSRSKADSQIIYDSQAQKSSRSKSDSRIKYDSQSRNDLQLKSNSQSKSDLHSKIDSQTKNDLRSKTNSQNEYTSQNRKDSQIKPDFQDRNDSQIRNDSHSKKDSHSRSGSQANANLISKAESQIRDDSQSLSDFRAKSDSEKIMKRENSYIEEEEERESSDDAIDIVVSDETNEKSLNFLEMLISKMKNKNKNNKRSSIDSLNLQPPLSPLTATGDTPYSKKKTNKTELPPQSSQKTDLQEQFEDQSNRKTITLKNKCYELDRYLEENGYNSTESESDHNLKNRQIRKNNNNNDFDFLRKTTSNGNNYIVEKENVQIYDVRECDYEFEPPYPRNMQHFLIFNVDDHKPKSTNKDRNIDNDINQQSSNLNTYAKITTPTQSRYPSNTKNDLLTRDNNDDSCSIPFSDSSSNSQFSSPSRRTSNHSINGQSPNSPRLSPRLQKMKENSSSRGTSPDAKMLRDKAIGNTYLSTKDQSVWCQLEEYNEEEENNNFEIETEPRKETKSQNQADLLYERLNRINREPANEDPEIKNRTYNRNNNKLYTIDNPTPKNRLSNTCNNNNSSGNNSRNRPTDERRNKSEIRERNTMSFSPSRSNPTSKRTANNKNSRTKGDLNNTSNLNSNQTPKFLRLTEKKPKTIIYAEHTTQTDDINNEDELLM